MTVQERAPRADESADAREWRCPSHFRYWEAREEPAWRRREKVVKRLFGHDLFPSDERARMLCDDLYGGDPVAERYVDEVFFGETGHQKAREQLMHALEHGTAPEESVRRWQRRMEPVQRTVFAGCHLTRDVPALLASAGWRVEDREQDYLPGPALSRPWTYVYRLVAG